jgi:predicted nucleic acid-binding protein
MNGQTKDLFVIDTNTAINFLNGKIPALPAGEDGDTQYFINVVTEMELFAYPQITPEEEQDIRSFLDDIAIIQLSEEVKLEAIRIRRLGSPRPKLPDAIIVATAVLLGASLITSDTNLLKLKWPGLQTVSMV